ncbi:MAG TPA: NADH-quinone oxidoreductase subunit J [Candidatus Dormibacteraeota bacterium]|jgi:NADH:ubiquinone oxidoreductase subunit 6 (subunit J)|nr:NADH-quinone oxidoreductase subunit J [Candidatus Dormibacteraeota bacterium]
MSVNGIVFYAFAAVAVVAALGVVGLPELRHAAYALAGMGAAVGLLFLLVGNELLFAVQILVYGLAVPAVLLVAVTLVGGRSRDQGAGWLSSWWPVAVLVAVGTGALLLGVVAVSGDVWVRGDYALDGKAVTQPMGDLIFKRYALPFGVSAVLLLTALVGAVAIGRRDDLEDELEAAEAARRHREERMRRRREDRERARAAQRPAAVAGQAEGE